MPVGLFALIIPFSSLPEVVVNPVPLLLQTVASVINGGVSYTEIDVGVPITHAGTVLESQTKRTEAEALNVPNQIESPAAIRGEVI